MLDYDRLSVRILSALAGELLPDTAWYVPERNEQRIAIAVCDATGMTPERWDRLTKDEKIPWLDKTLKALEKQPAPNAWIEGDDLPAYRPELARQAMADTERSSPFTIPEPAFKFAEGPPAEPPPLRSMTVGGLIHNLTIFADFYERASADIDRAELLLKPGAIGNRDAKADVMQWQFRATVGIDRARAYVLAKYGGDLTIGTARRLLGDLIRKCALAVDTAEALPLEAAMERLDAAELPRDEHPLDTTPDYPPVEMELVEAAANTLQQVFRNLPNDQSPRATDPGHGERIVRADRLVSAVAEAGHEAAAAAWAVHRCAEAGLLLAEVRNVEEEVGGREEIDRDSIVIRASRFFGERGKPPTVWIPGRKVVKPTFTGSGPVPFDCLLIRSTRAFWQHSLFIHSLLAGPDDAELTPRELALLEAHLRQPNSFATTQREKNATGRSTTEASRSKLTLIRDFNRGLQQAKGEGVSSEERSDAVPTLGAAEPTRGARPSESASMALMRVFTNGLADDRIEKATRLLSDGQLTANEKLTKIDALIPFPATASAEQLGEMLGVTKQAVLKTDWWIQNRKGEKESEVGRRREGHRKRAKSYEAPGQDDDG